MHWLNSIKSYGEIVFTFSQLELYFTRYINQSHVKLDVNISVVCELLTIENFYIFTYFVSKNNVDVKYFKLINYESKIS